jgi:putative peptidoglycan lipid II flippase
MLEKQQISRAVGSLGAATMLSRVAGLLRDIVVARVFGAGMVTDAFFMAFTLPNLLRRFFAEGSLTAAFVPTYTAVYQLQGEEESKRVASICWTLLLLVMLLVTVVGIAGSPLLVQAIGYGFESVPGKLALTDSLNRLMFPYILFVSLLALCTGILNVRGHYFLPAFSPVLLNLSMIASALLLAPMFTTPVTALALGVLLGGVLQLALQLPQLWRLGYRPRLNFSFADAAVRRIVRLMLPGVAGVAIYQINVVVSRLLASFLPQGSVSWLYYGQRLFEFPQGIVIASLAQAVLPSMSRQLNQNDEAGFRASLHFAFELLLLLILPATIGLVLCAEPVYSLFFLGGEFTQLAVHQSALALAAYAPGLLCVGASRIIVPAFYALQDTRTPVWVSFWTLLVNIVLGLLFMGPLAHLGLALALTLSSLFNALLLLILLRRRLGNLGLVGLTRYALRILPALMLMSVVVWLVLQGGDWANTHQRLRNGAVLLAAVFSGVVTYSVVCHLCHVPLLEEARALLRRKQPAQEQQGER